MENFTAVPFLNNEDRSLPVCLFKLLSSHQVFRVLIALGSSVTAILSLHHSQWELGNWSGGTKAAICPSWTWLFNFFRYLICLGTLLSLCIVTAVWWLLALYPGLRCWALTQFKPVLFLWVMITLTAHVPFSKHKEWQDFSVGRSSSWGLVFVWHRIILVTSRLLKGSHSRWNI